MAQVALSDDISYTTLLDGRPHSMADQNRLRPTLAAPPMALSDRWRFALPVLVLLLLTPTLFHGQPFLTWDTDQYYHYGAQLVDFATAKLAPTIAVATRTGSESGDDDLSGRARTAPPSTFDTTLIDQKSKAGGIAFYGGRSPFYSIWLYAIAWAFSLWAVLITQAVATAWIIWRAVTHAAGTHCFETTVAIAAICTVVAGAWFVVGFVMPDIYAAIAIICVALLFAHADRISFLERVVIAVILTVSALFHTSHLVITTILALAGIGVTYFLRSEDGRFRSSAVLATACALGVAVALQFAFDTAAEAVLGTSPKRPPLLTARIIADGPGRLYLDSACPKGATFIVCAYRGRTLSADEFLWGAEGVFATLPVEQRLRLIQEEPKFVAAVAIHDPLGVLKAAIGNAVEQFVLVWPADAWIDPGTTFNDPPWRGADLFQVAPFLKSCVTNLGSCVPAVSEAATASIVGITVVLSFFVIVTHFVAVRHRTNGTQVRDCTYERAIVFAILILVGLIVNAAICGAISGPHPRYQTRVAWLAVLAAGVLESVHPIVLPRFRRLSARATGSPPRVKK
jgi:hypothetical protein